MDLTTDEQRISDPEGITQVLVYGTLKSGHGNHRLLDGYRAISSHMEIPNLVMAHMGAFPAAVKVENMPHKTVKCELYRIPFKLLAGPLDTLESHPDWYKREIVQLPYRPVVNYSATGADRNSYGCAWIYLMPYELCLEDKDSKVVTGGDWLVNKTYMHVVNWHGSHLHELAKKRAHYFEEEDDYSAYGAYAPWNGDSDSWGPVTTARKEVSKVVLEIGPGVEEISANG